MTSPDRPSIPIPPRLPLAARLAFVLALALMPGCQGWKPGAAIARWIAEQSPATAPSKAEQSADDKRIDAELAEQRRAPDPRVRATAMGALAQRHHPQAAAWLSAAASGDIDQQVRLAAVAGLGTLATPEAQAALVKLAHGSREAIRAAAVDALAQWGPPSAVLEVAGDHSRRVRLSVAGAVARYPSPEAVSVAERLLTDPGVEVQCRVVASMAKWPVEMAGPVLLEAMEKSAYATRKAAGEQLAARWPGAADYQPDDQPERRTELIERLRSQFIREFPAARPAARPVEPPRAVAPEALSRAEACVRDLASGQLDAARRQQAIEALNELGAELLPALNVLVAEKHMVLPDLVYSEVLAGKDPRLAQIERLKSAAVAERREAAEGLAQALGTRPPGLLVAERLASIVIHESDPLVWETVLGALAEEPGEPAMRLARTALSHNYPEVRRRACLNLAAHPHEEDEKLLVHALGDTSSAVAIAAAQALGALRRVEDPEPLRRAARTAAEPLRSEATVALARLGDPLGQEGLMRLASSGDPILRRRAALAMGALGDQRYASPLAGMLSDRPAVRRAAIESLKQIAGRDVGAEGGPPADSAELARRWKRWAEAQPVR